MKLKKLVGAMTLTAAGVFSATAMHRLINLCLLMRKQVAYQAIYHL